MTATKPCSVTVCDKPAHGNGLCSGHNQRRRRGLPIDVPLGTKTARTGVCTGPECTDPVLAASLCAAHYEQQRTGRPLTVKRRFAPRDVPCAVGTCTREVTSEGLCQTHYRRRLRGDRNWDSPILPKAANGEGHLDKQGYRIVSVNGRPVREHIAIAEHLLGRPLVSYRDEKGRLVKVEEVHHVDGQRARNDVDGPFVMDDRGRLRSGNLEVWSKAQPAGQEIGPKLDWALDMLRTYLATSPGHVEQVRAVLADLDPDR